MRFSVFIIARAFWFPANESEPLIAAPIRPRFPRAGRPSRTRPFAAPASRFGLRTLAFHPRIRRFDARTRRFEIRNTHLSLRTRRFVPPIGHNGPPSARSPAATPT